MKKLVLKFLIAISSLTVITGCHDETGNYYDRPDYLRGNAYKFLQERGNFNYFLSAAEMVGFKDALDGRGIYSVFAPNDEAFERYMKRMGKNSLKDFPLDSLNMLIGYHLVEFSFSKTDFLAFSKTSSSEEGKPGDGSCYKYKTVAREKPILVTDPTTGRQVKVFQQERFLPVISTRLFRTRECVNYEDEYKTFFPSIAWQGDNDQLYVANAAVIESGIPIDNGYMYIVNEVIETLPTVYTALGQQYNGQSFKYFKNLYDRFAVFKYDGEVTKNYAQLGDSLFIFQHYKAQGSSQDLPDIASQWTVREQDGDYEARMKYTFNCFAPTDDKMEKYILKFFDGVQIAKDVPELSLFYLLNAHIEDKKELILPVQIEKGLEGQYGEIWPIRKNNIVATKFCTNGVLYGIDQVLEPAAFSMVTQPLFKYARFSTMANVAHKQGIYQQLIDPEREFTLFVVSNENLDTKYGIIADYQANSIADNAIDRTGIKWWVSQTDHSLKDMDGANQQAFVTNQVVNGYIDLENKKERRFYATRNQYHFIYVENGDIYGENGANLTPTNTWKFTYKNGSGRGIAYEMDDKFQSNTANLGRALYENSGRFRKFYQQLLKANLLTYTPTGDITDKTVFKMDWLNGRHMVFAPTNEAWDESVIPSDSLALDSYLKYFFISMEENKIEDYILPNYGIPGELETLQSHSLTVKAKMQISWADDKRLRITNEDNTSVFTDDKIPYFATDALIYGITSMIQSKSK